MITPTSPAVPRVSEAMMTSSSPERVDSSDYLVKTMWKNQDFQTLLMNSDPGQVSVSYQGKLVDTVYTELGFRTPAEFSTATAPAGHTMLNTVPVSFIHEHEKLPPGFILALPQGSREYFATQASLRYKVIITC